VGRRDVHGVRAGLGAAAAGLGAGAPGIPGVHAVDGAGVGVAVLPGFEVGARGATADGCRGNRPGLLLHPPAALLGAGAPSAPESGMAVDRAALGAAGLGVAEGGALDATVLHVDDNGAGPGPRAPPAGLRASRELREARCLAIDGAGLRVADALFRQGALCAAVGSSAQGLVLADLRATTAALGAGAPGIPGVIAVD
jgi:hypothetical protein